MKQTSTHTKDTFIIRCLLLLFVLTNMVAVSVTAHNVTGYTPSCGSGPQYSVTAAVTNVNSTSNYRWQWKNPSGSWICFVNGTNNINGISYNVSGAVYNLTTNPGPIIFTNPDIGLNGLEIRMVISDGSGVDPCTLPSGNTWTSSTNLIINVAGTSCGAAVNIGNLVWWDKNDNGIKDASEAGWPWALNVNLYRDQDQNGVADAGWVTRTVAIDGNGNYNFTNVPAGNYFVTLTNPYPNDWFKSSVNAGDPDNDIDNDNNGVNSLSSNAVIAGLPISLTLGGEPATGVDGDGTNGNLTYDFGLWKGNGLGDYVWLDDNVNGIQDAGESGISGVTVTLSKGATTYTTTTDANGYYYFADIYDLANGGYTLTFNTPFGYTPSPANQGADDAKDSDPINGVITGIAVPIGTWNHTFDAGFYKQTCPIGGLNISNLVQSHMLFTNGSADANWQGATKGFAGDVLIDGIQATERSSGTVPFSGTIFTNDASLSQWQNIVNANAGQATAAYNQTAKIATAETELENAFTQINAMTATPGYTGIAPTALNGLNTQDGIEQTYVINITSGFTVSTQINITGDASDIFILRWDNDANFANGYNGQVKFQSGGAIVPLGGLRPSNFIHVAGDIASSGGGSNPPAPYPQGPRYNNGAGGLINGGTDFAGGGFFTGYWLTTGAPTITGSGQPYGATSSLSNAIFVGGWYSKTTQFSMTSGTSGVYVSPPACSTIGSLGNRVWEDVNRNGIQDGTEVGVSGITVSLYNSSNTLVATTVTDGYGNYLFTNLPVSFAGINYQVRFSLPPQYVVTPQSQGSDITIDSDPATNTGRTSNILLTTANKDRVDVDAGIYYSIPARIGDFIWNDANKNGIQDAGEPGIAGVTVTLYNNAGVAVRSTITDNNGYYLFTDVPAGNYTLGITPPVGYIVTGKDIGSDDAKDSDFDPLTFKTGTFTVVNGTSNLTFDGGLYVTPTTVAAVGDKVWNDLNANNLQDSNEPGVSGVTVQLYTGAGVLVATQVTDVFGNYMFNNLTPGSYYVKFSNLPSGYVLVAANQGGVANYQIDSDVTGANGTGTTATFSLVADETKVTVDAGIRNPSVTANSSLGDYVWYDLNKNGIQDAGEAGVPGVTATLYNATTNAVLATTTTDGSGLYLFTDLAIGSYKVGFTNLPAGYIFSAKDQGADDNIDSDVDPNTGITGSYNIAANGTTIRTVDAGIKSDPNVRIGKASLGDKVWNDINNNGIQDAGEPGVPGITVTLYAADGTTVIATTTTDGFGNYIFTNLDAGTYVVGFSGLPAGYVFGTKDAGTDDGKDSDADVSTGKSGQVTLAAGEVNLTIDAGIKASVTKSSLGDKVWYDNNNNGIQDAGEMGVKGVSVTLYNTGNAVLSTASTDANGYYLFTNLDAGSYIVGFSNLPAGYTPTTQNASGSTTANNSDANVSTGKTATITLAASTSDLTWDMGIVTTARAAVGDYVWSDLNNNGIQDAGEPAVSGITVTLYNSAGTAIASTVTDANGYYMFNNIIPATGFTIGFSNIPANSSFTTKNASGSTTANNSDVNTATGRTDAFNLVAGQIKTDVDAGLITLFAAVGDYVWYDTNANGKQDAGEVGVPGVTVKLYDVNGNVVASAVTDGNGKYFINNIPVPAGGSTFTIGFSDLPINATGWTLKNAPGTTAANNSDVNAANGRTDAFVLLPGSIDLTRDGGIITSGGGPLPLTFTNLKGVYNNGVSNLSWASLSEQNFSHFEVEYSTNGVNFSYIGRVNGAGNSSSKIDYAYAHKQPVAGVNYYRLKMVDKDGRYTYSNVVALNVTIKGINITGAYPNPFVDKVNITLSADVTDKALVRIFDATGKVVISNENKIQRGTAVITITNLAKLAQGMYVIEVRIADKVFTQKLIK